MSNTFVPLIAAQAAAETAAFQLKVLPQAEAKGAFQPLPGAAEAEQAAKACGQPRITLQRQGEMVCGIRVQCGCGQVIELACDY
jgi:hypothetical protein